MFHCVDRDLRMFPQFFTEPAHWADSVIESRCPSAGLSVCLCVCMYVPCEEDLSFHWRGLLHTPCVTPWEPLGGGP